MRPIASATRARSSSERPSAWARAKDLAHVRCELHVDREPFLRRQVFGRDFTRGAEARFAGCAAELFAAICRRSYPPACVSASELGSTAVPWDAP